MKKNETAKICLELCERQVHDYLSLLSRCDPKQRQTLEACLKRANVYAQEKREEIAQLEAVFVGNAKA